MSSSPDALPAASKPGWTDQRCVPDTVTDSPQTVPADLVTVSRSENWYGRDGLWAVVDVHNLAWDRPDGRVGVKFGWWRMAPGQLSIRAERLDGAGMATAEVPEGYGPTGFQASGVDFSAEGCWRVTGILGETQVAFVVAVRTLPPS